MHNAQAKRTSPILLLTKSGRNCKQFGTSRKLQHTADHRSRLQALSSEEVEVLQGFWQARGVKDSEHRSRLIDYGCDKLEDDPEIEYAVVNDVEEPQLPGAHALWHLKSNAQQQLLVRAITAKLIALHALLGNRQDIDVAGMLIKCPRLLTASSSDIVQRLVKMKGTDGAAELDIVQILELQPSLLLHQSSDHESPGLLQIYKRTDLDAWRFGLTSSADDEWLKLLKALEDYQTKHGHAHTGFSEADGSDLIKFARMQRASFKNGTLLPERKQALDSLGFEFDSDKAEWAFMYTRLQAAQNKAARDDSLLDGGFDFLLNNWCAVQRISNRSGVLSGERKRLLDAVSFDWTGADALS